MDLRNYRHRREAGFTLLEAAFSLIILMIIGVGVAPLFTYAIKANSNANDRELSMAIAQKRMEWLRTIPFTTQTRHLAFSYPNGGLEVTSDTGVNETVTNAGRSYTVNTVIQNLSVVPVGKPDAGEPTVKSIKVSVTPAGAASTFETVSVTTQRSTQVTGSY